MLTCFLIILPLTHAVPCFLKEGQVFLGTSSGRRWKGERSTQCLCLAGMGSGLFAARSTEDDPWGCRDAAAHPYHLTHSITRFLGGNKVPFKTPKGNLPCGCMFL